MVDLNDLPQAFWVWAGVAHISDKKAHKFQSVGKQVWAEDDEEHADDYSEEGSYEYSDEVGRKDTTMKGEVIFKQQC